jgi:hypothetical protein
VVTVRDAKEVEALIGKSRTNTSSAAKTSAGRDLREPTELIVQEGVLTNERVHNGVAEPVVYMMDRYVVGGFYRVHAEQARRRKPQAAGRELRAAGFFRECALAAARRQARRERAEPLLHVRRGRPAGHGGGQLRDGSDRSGRRNLRMIEGAGLRRRRATAK